MAHGWTPGKGAMCGALALLAGCAAGVVPEQNGKTEAESAAGADDGGSGDGGAGDGGSGDGDSGDGGSGDGDAGDGGSGDGDSGDGGSGEDGSEDGGSGDGGSEDGGDDGDPDPVAQDTRAAGPYTSTTSTASVAVDSDCTFDVTIVTPDGPPVGAVVVSHGFIRTGARVLGWAEHYASWGLVAVVPELCHLSAFDSDHAANGEELALLPDALGLGPTAYVGHSAGGLASALALTHDADAVGGVGLDPVDSAGLGAAASAGVPFSALLGEPGLCNSNGNGTDMVSGAVWKVVEAGHCDFESPRDSICDLACSERNPTFSDAELQDTIAAMSTAALLGLFGDTTTQSAWWTSGGSYFDALVASGALSAP